MVVAADLEGVVSVVEVSGPGFINLTLSNDFIASQVSEVSVDPRLGVAVVTPSQTVLIDYSSPNVAKEMHVGHLRTTVIGDALAACSPSRATPCCARTISATGERPSGC